ncbi:MAG: ankyrin repeat domain-containing protein, partial [Bryobacterales bacterium]|nr:ankyrin repeat domain-containing protein [Bryobacterales bacterium]
MRMPVAFLASFLSLLPAADSTPSEQIYQAIRNDDAPAVVRLLNSGIAVNSKDSRGTTPLMYAAAVGSEPMMRRLIKAGADVNAKNNFEAMALHWCAGSPAKVRLLVEHSADVNARSKMGHTPLGLAARHAGNAEAVRLLLAKGASVSGAVDNLGLTPLIGAAQANDTEMMKLLLEKGEVADAADKSGSTALMWAAGFGNVEMVKVLLGKGARVNAQSAPSFGPGVKNGPIAIGSLTPLILAASGSSVETVRLLLEAGAEVNARDVRGMTPLMLAVATDHPNAKILEMLLARKPDTGVKSKAGETAQDWAAKFRDPGVLAFVKAPLPELRAVSRTTGGDTKAAVQKAVALMQRAAETNFREGGCISCHAGNMATVAVAAARRKGVHVNEVQAAETLRGTKLQFTAFAEGLLERFDPPAPEILSHALFALAMENQPADRVIDAMVQNLASQQLSDGSWGAGGILRPPTNDGPFSMAAMAIRVLREYAPPGRRAAINEQIARAARLLAVSKPTTTEDCVMQLLGLTWARSNEVKPDKLIRNVLALQRENGGWAQTPYLQPDAYATGTALIALHEAGVASTSPAYQKGVRFLLETQAEDGSWF